MYRNPYDVGKLGNWDQIFGTGGRWYRALVPSSRKPPPPLLACQQEEEMNGGETGSMEEYSMA